MLLGRFGEDGEVGESSPLVVEGGVRSRCDSEGLAVEMARASLRGAGAGGVARVGESGGGGMSVPAVRESKWPRTGSSNLRVGVGMVGGWVVGGLGVVFRNVGRRSCKVDTECGCWSNREDCDCNRNGDYIYMIDRR